MNDTLSKNWLFICAGIGASFVGIYPAILSYVILVMGFLWLFMLRDVDGSFVKPNRITVIFSLVLLSWAAISLQWSLIPARALYDLVVILLLGWIGVQSTASMAVMEPKDAGRLIRIVTAAFLVALLFFAADSFFDVVVQRAVRNAPWSKFLPLALVTRSCFCTVLILWPVAVYVWQRGLKFSAVLLWFTLGILTLFTDTAAGRLAFVASSLVFALANFSPKLLRITFSAIILAGFMIAVPAAKIAQDTIGDAAHRMSGSFGQRTEIWTFAAKRIMEKPILGWGFDSSRAIPNFGEISVYQGNDPTKSIIPMHPHDWLLQIWLELGAVGCVLTAAFWIWLIWQTEKFDRRVQPAALAVIAVVFTIGAFSIGIWQVWWWAVVLFAIWVLQWLNRAQSQI
jgi:hypothetical protein